MQGCKIKYNLIKFDHPFKVILFTLSTQTFFYQVVNKMHFKEKKQKNFNSCFYSAESQGLLIISGLFKSGGTVANVRKPVCPGIFS